MSKKRVLFICTGNSARSQMAEALVNHYLSDVWETYPAGTEPAGYVHPLALKALQEAGIETAGLRSKSMDEFRLADFDVAITLCDGACAACAVSLGKGPKREHIGFPDPAAATGSDEERLEVFRRVRDDIREGVFPYLSAYLHGAPTGAA